MTKKYILLSTYDPNGSRNLGDHLLTASAEKILKREKPDAQIVSYFREEDLNGRLDELNAADAILLPGFAIRHETYPKTYRLVDDLDKLETPIIPIGCGTKFRMPSRRFDIDRASLGFVHRIAEWGGIPCRELITWNTLKGHGIDVSISGDLGMFDPDYIGKPFQRPESIKTLIFTTPHGAQYLEQTKAILDMLVELLPQTEKIISFQSVFKHGSHEHESEIARYGKARGFRILHPVQEDGDEEPLAVYENADFHIGYRCHGHLYFLRTRRPSILISEDSRGVGFSEILGLPVFAAFNPRFSEPCSHFAQRVANRLRRAGVLPENTVNTNLVKQVGTFLNEELHSGFLRYAGLGDKLDTLYENGMKRFIQRLP